MKPIDIFYQGENIHGIDHLELEPDKTFNHLKILISKKHELSHDFLLFIEDSEHAVDDSQLINAHAKEAGIKAHVH